MSYFLIKFGENAEQRSQSLMQSLSSNRISCLADWLSGFWHQKQPKEQPFKNTTVRIPGPSWMEYRL